MNECFMGSNVFVGIKDAMEQSYTAKTPAVAGNWGMIP
jgi:hypothetical protein